LSNLIKSSHVVSLEDLKRLEQLFIPKPEPQNISASDSESEGNSAIDVETNQLKERILADAEASAREILRQAHEAAKEVAEQAEREAEAWWQSRRDEDDAVREQASKEGFAQGYRQGAQQAEQDLVLQWEDRLLQAQAIVDQAYDSKERIFEEAEAFVVDLSCSIAEKIVGLQLKESPDSAMKMFSDALARRKEQGVIALCVSPAQFAFVESAKDELKQFLNSQAELQIIPDSSVGDGGCIVRSAFGSIDARVDTKLSSIREQLLRVAAHSAEEEFRDAAP
jgi:flagellar assembly protein FliH